MSVCRFFVGLTDTRGQKTDDHHNLIRVKIQTGDRMSKVCCSVMIHMLASFSFLCLFDYLYLSAAGSASTGSACLFFLWLFDVCLCLLLSIPKARVVLDLQTRKGKGNNTHIHSQQCTLLQCGCRRDTSTNWLEEAVEGDRGEEILKFACVSELCKQTGRLIWIIFVLRVRGKLPSNLKNA